MPRLAALLHRAAENFRMDWRLLRAPFPALPARLAFVVQKYVAVVTGRDTVRWFGRSFAYDNRWTPALLEDYPGEVARVISAAGLSGAATVLDVGANVGQFASTVRGALPQSRVWSLEPNPEVRALLERNAGGDPQWTVVPYGVSDQDTMIDFYFVRGKSAQGSIHSDNATLGLLGGTAEHVQVPVQRLTPERLEEIGAPTRFDLVKIDVEGAERQALHGLRDVRWSHLMIELSANRNGQMTRGELLEQCRELWGVEMEVAAVLRDNAIAQEVVLRNPAVAG